MDIIRNSILNMLEFTRMLNGDLKDEAIKKLENSVKRHGQLANKAKTDSINLFKERVTVATTLIKSVEDYFTSLSNSPKEFDKTVRKYRIEVDRFDRKVKALNIEAAEVEDYGTGVMVGGAAAGVGVAALAPTAALAVATTFGTASTGVAISTLGGAAATNAALAWLGGGALAAGGGGMGGGNEDLMAVIMEHEGEHTFILSLSGKMVAASSSKVELRKAYLLVSAKVHPDKNPGSQAATKAFQVLVEAFERLANPEKFEEDEEDDDGKPAKKRQKTERVVRGNSNCFATKIKCPRCREVWSTTYLGLEDAAFNFLMSGIKQYICGACFAKFGCMTAIHYCPHCKKTFEYVTVIIMI